MECSSFQWVAKQISIKQNEIWKKNYLSVEISMYVPHINPKAALFSAHSWATLSLENSRRIARILAVAFHVYQRATATMMVANKTLDEDRQRLRADMRTFISSFVNLGRLSK